MPTSHGRPQHEFVVTAGEHCGECLPLDQSCKVLFFGRMPNQKHSEGKYIVHLAGSTLRHEFRLEWNDEKRQFKFCDGPSSKGTRTINGTNLKGSPEHWLAEGDVIAIDYQTAASSGILNTSITLMFRRTSEQPQ